MKSTPDQIKNIKQHVAAKVVAYLKLDSELEHKLKVYANFAYELLNRTGEQHPICGQCLLHFDDETIAVQSAMCGCSRMHHRPVMRPVRVHRDCSHSATMPCVAFILKLTSSARSNIASTASIPSSAVVTSCVVVLNRSLILSSGQYCIVQTLQSCRANSDFHTQECQHDEA